MLALNIYNVRFKPVKYVITVSQERSDFINCDVIVLDNLLLFIPEKELMYLDYSHDVLKKEWKCERCYPIQTQSFDNYCSYETTSRHVCRAKNNKSTVKFDTITNFFSLLISTGNCMSITVSKLEWGLYS